MENGQQRSIVPSDSITPSLKQFIFRYVRSVEQVEILCLLGEDPAKIWTVAQVLRTIQSSDKSIEASLEAFCKDGFLSSEQGGTYRFCPKSGELNNAVLELIKAYRERRVTVVEAIYSKPADTLQDFADAFKLRKDK